MFETISALLFAFSQLTMLFVGLVFFGIGALLILYPIWQWLSGIRVNGRIVAVRATGLDDSNEGAAPTRRRAREMYYPVFEYKTPEGRTVQAMGDSGSSALGDKIPGAPVRLLLRHDDFESPSRPGIVMYVIGAIFALPGLVFLYQGVQSLDVSVYTLLVGLGLSAYLGLKVRKYIKPRDQWDTVTRFRARKKAEGRHGGAC